MAICKSVNITKPTEAVIPVPYIESYTDQTIKDIIKDYKFSHTRGKAYLLARAHLQDLLNDFITETHIFQKACCQTKTLHVYTSPPSTMYARGEKDVDSMRELFRDYVDVYKTIFYIPHKHLKTGVAQHLGNSKHQRIEKSRDKYRITLLFRLYIWYQVHLKNTRSITFYIIDDICTTGSTLKSCSDVLDTYIKKLQQKTPSVSGEVKVFSLIH